MQLVKHLKDFDLVGKELRSLLEGDAMLELVGLIFGFIPLELHFGSVRQWRSKSMAEQVNGLVQRLVPSPL